MNILMLDVAASSGGALTVLQQYYNEVQKDKANTYYFCISTPEMESCENVRILRFPWVKKSWFHRLRFELIDVPKLVKQYKIDRVFSLQNLLLSNPHCEKWIYLHQSIPFVETRFSFREDTLLWVHQNIIGRLIISSIKRVDKVIVQTQWMKEACCKKGGISKDRVDVQCPIIETTDIIFCKDRDAVKKKLFYPAAAWKYKNHMLLLRAMNRLKEEDRLGSLTLDLTLSGNENELAQELFHFAQKHELPVHFLGTLPREEVMKRYATSTLVFPSYVETFGLPLLEAKISGTNIIASNCAFSREILDGYDAAALFDPHDELSLSTLLKI